MDLIRGPFGSLFQMPKGRTPSPATLMELAAPTYRDAMVGFARYVEVRSCIDRAIGLVEESVHERYPDFLKDQAIDLVATLMKYQGELDKLVLGGTVVQGTTRGDWRVVAKQYLHRDPKWKYSALSQAVPGVLLCVTCGKHETPGGRVCGACYDQERKSPLGECGEGFVHCTYQGQKWCTQCKRSGQDPGTCPCAMSEVTCDFCRGKLGVKVPISPPINEDPPEILAARHDEEAKEP